MIGSKFVLALITPGLVKECSAFFARFMSSEKYIVPIFREAVT